MRRLFSFFLVFVCMFISFRGVIANNMGDDFGEESFFKVEEEVASVSSKYAQKVSETPAILSVFTREQLQDMGCRTLADALRFVPGIGVSIDELGGYNKVAIRGVRQWPNVLFLVDGQRLNDFYTGLALYDFPIDNIEKVEIIRGPGSSIHGTGGFVGVISIITNQNIPEGFTAKSEAGKDKTLRTSINWSGKIEGWKTNLFAEIYQTDGQKHQLYGSPTQINLLQGRTQPHLPISSINMTGDDVNVPLENQKRNNMQSYNDYFVNGYELALVDIGKTKEDKQKITLDYKMMKDNTNLRFKYIYDSRGPNIGMFGWKLPNTNLARGIYTAYLDRSNKLSDNCDIITKFYFDRQMVDNRLQTSADTPLIGEVSESNRGDYQILKYAAQTFGTEIQVNYRISKHNFVSGLQFERLGLEDYSLEKENSAGIMQEIQQENKSRTVLGLFIQDEFRPNEFIGLTAGVRTDRYSDFGRTTNPKIGGVYLFGKHFKKESLKGLGLKLSYATAFRAPTFQELYDKTQADLVYGAVGTADLKPETIKTYEAAIEYEYKWLRVKTNYYTNEIENQIGVQPGLLGTVQGVSNPYFNNPGLIKSKGYEFEIRTTKATFAKLFPDMWSWLNISKVKVEADGFITPKGNKFDAVTRTELPQWELSLGINSGITDKFRIALNYERISERFSNIRATTERETKSRWAIPEQDEYNLHIYTTDKLLKDYTFGIKAFNITDKTTYDDPTTIGSQEVERENKTILGYMKVKF